MPWSAGGGGVKSLIDALVVGGGRLSMPGVVGWERNAGYRCQVARGVRGRPGIDACGRVV
jgi:hypothetical protein